jgi:hypothetical protein
MLLPGFPSGGAGMESVPYIAIGAALGALALAAYFAKVVLA